MYDLGAILLALDQWVARENVQARADGVPMFRKSAIRVLGQFALWVSTTGLTLTTTQDLDAYADCEWAVQKELERLLAKNGLILDPHGRKVWMPRETIYRPIYEGAHVSGFVADIEAVLISKALKAPDKNKSLLTEYLAQGASERFSKLATKYQVDLEQFL